MADPEDKSAEQLAAEINASQQAQVDPTTEGSQPSAGAPATNGELILGKFKTQDDLIASYQELERERTISRQNARPPVQQPAAPAEPAFDAETMAAINSTVDQRVSTKLEFERANTFARVHADELKDPLLRGAVLVEIQEANARGEYMDQETALSHAKAALDARLTPKVEKASQEAVEESKAIARRKEQAGAVGGTNAVIPEKDDTELSAAEYAAKYQLPRGF